MAKSKINYSDAILDVARDMTRWKFTLGKILKDCGEVTENKSFKELMDMVENLKIMKKNRKYKGINLDVNGYIIGTYNLIDFIDFLDMPNDIDCGYYKINEDGVLVVDHERKRQLEEV